MGPFESPTDKHRKQHGRPRRPAKRRARRPRQRKCLLKGCEQRFHPRNSRQRYCSPRCREEARTWSRWRAQQRYRATATGQAETQRPKPALPGTGPKPENRSARGGCHGREGNHRQLFSGLVATGQAATKPSPQQRRSPLQHFCSHACRQALKRVRQRERRWKQARI